MELGVPPSAMQRLLPESPPAYALADRLGDGASASYQSAWSIPFTQKSNLAEDNKIYQTDHVLEYFWNHQENMQITRTDQESFPQAAIKMGQI